MALLPSSIETLAKSGSAWDRFPIKRLGFILAGALLVNTSLRSSLNWIDAHTAIKAHDNFSEIDGYRLASPAKLSVPEKTVLGIEENSFRFYLNHSSDLAQNLSSSSNMTADASIRASSAAQVTKTLQDVQDLSLKAILINHWANNLIDFDTYKFEHGTNDPNWYRGAFETIVWGKGVCIDQALAKYEMLRLSGFPEEKMALLVMTNADNKTMNKLHTALLLDLPEGRYVMSNLKGESRLIELTHFLNTHRIEADMVLEFRSPCQM